MTLSTVNSSLIFRSSTVNWDTTGTPAIYTASIVDGPTESIIRNLIAQIYSSSDGAALLERGVTTEFIRFAIYYGEVARAHVGSVDAWISVDPAQWQDVYWFNDHGELVNGNVALIIAHELSHIIDNTDDPLALSPTGEFIPPTDSMQNAGNWDADGDAVRLQNVVARQIGMPDQVRTSYSATVDLNAVTSGFLATGISYTNNSVVSIVRLGDQQNVNQANTQDHTARLDNSADLIFGFGGDDYIHGGGGKDHLYGGDGDDEVFGGLGNDRIFGEMGDDVIAGNVGFDLLHGGENFYVDPQTVYADDGYDIADYSVFDSSNAQGIRIDITNFASNYTHSADAGFERAVFVADLARDNAVDTLISIQEIIATNSDDILRIIDLNPDRINGDNSDGVGVNFINLGGQSGLSNSNGDVINLRLLNESARVDLDVGAKTVSSFDETRFVEVRGAERVIGSAYSDVIKGSFGDDRLEGGGGGFDELRGREGNDRLVIGDNGGGVVGGGKGDDIIDARNSNGNVVVEYYRGDGYDRISVDANSPISSLNYDNLDSFRYAPGDLLDPRHIVWVDFVDISRAEVQVRWAVTQLDTETNGSGDIARLVHGNLSVYLNGQLIMALGDVVGEIFDMLQDGGEDYETSYNLFGFSGLKFVDGFFEFSGDVADNFVVTFPGGQQKIASTSNDSSVFSRLIEMPERMPVPEISVGDGIWA